MLLMLLLMFSGKEKPLPVPMSPPAMCPTPMPDVEMEGERLREPQNGTTPAQIKHRGHRARAIARLTQRLLLMIVIISSGGFLHFINEFRREEHGYG